MAFRAYLILGKFQQAAISCELFYLRHFFRWHQNLWWSKRHHHLSPNSLEKNVNSKMFSKRFIFLTYFSLVDLEIGQNVHLIWADIISPIQKHFWMSKAAYFYWTFIKYFSNGWPMVVGQVVAHWTMDWEIPCLIPTRHGLFFSVLSYLYVVEVQHNKFSALHQKCRISCAAWGKASLMSRMSEKTISQKVCGRAMWGKLVSVLSQT